MFSQNTIALLCLFSLAAAAGAQEFQTWNEADITASWRRVDFVAPLLARADPNKSNKLFVAVGVTADYRLSGRLILTGGYLFVDLPGVPAQVHAPVIAASESLRIRRVTISDRNRFEKLIGLGTFGKAVGLGASPWRYRNRALLDLSFGSSERWHAFANDEVFYDFAVTRWNQNRAQVGGGFRFSKRLHLDVYFIQQNTNRPAEEIRAVGSILRVALTY